MKRDRIVAAIVLTLGLPTGCADDAFEVRAFLHAIGAHVGALAVFVFVAGVVLLAMPNRRKP